MIQWNNNWFIRTVFMWLISGVNILYSAHVYSTHPHTGMGPGMGHQNPEPFVWLILIQQVQEICSNVTLLFHQDRFLFLWSRFLNRVNNLLSLLNQSEPNERFRILVSHPVLSIDIAAKIVLLYLACNKLCFQTNWKVESKKLDFGFTECHGVIPWCTVVLSSGQEVIGEI